MIGGKGTRTNEGCNEFNDSKNACPKGWRLPTKQDFETLI